MIFALAAALLQAAVPAVAPAAPRPSVITAPDWLRKPTAADMAEFYPKVAAASHVEGRATIHCRVTASGDLTDCAVTTEDPSGQGFGDAALHLSALFKMKPMTRDGVPVSGAQINIPIRFALPKRESLPSAEVTLRCYGYAAAEAERNPASDSAQLSVFAFRLMIEFRLTPEKPRPSEFEAVLSSQRKIAEGRLDDPKYQADRDECRALLGDPAPKLKQLLDAIPN
jgi:TonB family protein